MLLIYICYIHINNLSHICYFYCWHQNR